MSRAVGGLAVLVVLGLGIALTDRTADAFVGDVCYHAKDCLAGREVCFTTALGSSAGRCVAGKMLP